MEVLGVAVVGHLLGHQATDTREGAVGRPHHVRDGDLRRWPTQAESALGATLAGDEPGATQVHQDVLHVLLRHGLRLRDRRALDRPVVSGSGEHQQRAHRVVGFGGDVHPLSLAVATPAQGWPLSCGSLAVACPPMITARFSLHPIAAAWEAAVADLQSRDAVRRLWELDSTLFADDPTEIANRMGWLRVADFTRQRWPQLAADAKQLAAEVHHVVVAGMGGSSLFPEVVAATFDRDAGFPRLHVLDSTDPAAVARVAAECPPERTFVVAASKSGTTVETRSHLAWFWERHPDPSRFGVITDPGSALGDLARQRGFRHVWENDPDIGGRYSALSLFGMVPAALAGVDGLALLDAADEAASSIGPLDDDDAPDVALSLGAAIGAAAGVGRNKLTIVLDPRIATFGLWLEQLVAESLGKHGVGALPVVGEPVDIALAHPDDRLVVTVGEVAGRDELRAGGLPLIELALEEIDDVGAHVLVWEAAVAYAGRVLGINPFDQPDVEAAKAAARSVLAAGAPPAPPLTPLDDALAAVQPGDYVAICAFVDPRSDAASRLEGVRARLGRRLGVATTLGIGPRFLHSTGQFHKGGPRNGVFLQVLHTEGDDLAIPEQSFTFGELKAAQAAGDLQALHAAGQQRAFRVSLEALLDA